MSVIFITHFLDQVYEISDRITVLRNGRLVGTYTTADLPRVELVARMIGRDLTELEEMDKFKHAGGRQADQAPALQARNYGRVGAIAPFDLDLHAGEVVGLAGLLGSGRTELASLLFGAEKPDMGELTVGQKPVTHHSPLNSIRLAMAFCPEDRKADGIVGDLTVRENIILAMQSNRGWFKHFSAAKQREIADRYIKPVSYTHLTLPTSDLV